MTETNYSVAHLWAQGDSVNRSVAVLLLLMSLASWSVMLIKASTLWRMRRQVDSAQAFWHATSYEQGVELLAAHADNPFHDLVNRGQEATQHHSDKQNELHGVLNLSDWLMSCLRQSLDDSASRLQSGLSILASVGSTAPFIGLFGTVWGIYHALISISASGQASIDKVAGPVGESLVMTAMGLAVAIPAVLGYNALVRGNKGVMGKLKHFAHDLHAYLVVGKSVRHQAPRPLKQVA